MLTWFHMVLDLKINLRKCELIRVGEAENIEMLVYVFNCKVGKLPTIYLRLPLGGASYKDPAT